MSLYEKYRPKRFEDVLGNLLLRSKTMETLNEMYNKFKQIVNSDKTRARYESSFKNDEVICFQLYGFSAEQVDFFWKKYKRERRKYPDLYKHYRFSTRSAALFKS